MLGELSISTHLFYLREYYLQKKPRWLDAPPMHQMLDRFEPGRALDAGCGTGRNAGYLAERGFDVVGIDISRRALRWARRRAPSVKFRRLPASRIAELEGHFDLILDVFGPACDLEGARLRAYADGVRRRLAPGGHFLLFSYEGASAFDLPLLEKDDGHPAGSWYVFTSA